MRRVRALDGSNWWGGGRWRAEATTAVSRKWTGRRRWRRSGGGRRARGFYWGSISGATRRSAPRGRELCLGNCGGRVWLGPLPRLGLRGGRRRGTELVDPPRASTTRRQLLRFPGTEEPRPDRPHRGSSMDSRGGRGGRRHGATVSTTSQRRDTAMELLLRQAPTPHAAAVGEMQLELKVAFNAMAASQQATPTPAPPRTSTGSSPCMTLKSSLVCKNKVLMPPLHKSNCKSMDSNLPCKQNGAPEQVDMEKLVPSSCC